MALDHSIANLRRFSMNPLDNLRTAFASGVYEPLFWKVKRMPVLEHYRCFGKMQWDSQQTYLKRLRNKIRTLLLHAYDHVPGYRARLITHFNRSDIVSEPLAVLKHIPVLAKEDIMEKPEEFTCELNRGTFANSSGGSTGVPVNLLQDQIYQAATLGATYLLYEWAYKLPGESYIKVWGAPRDITHNGMGFKFLLQNYMANRHVANAFKLSPDDMLALARKIDRFRPKLIEGYADGLFEIATFYSENGIRLSHPPKSIISSAGSLLDYMRERIQAVFKTTVFDRYGSREAGNMASECSAHNGLHIMGETTFLEIIDAEGRRLPHGTEGDIAVTNLWNFTMPLIRYRVGDRGIMAHGACPCGRPYPLLKAVTGRASTSLRLHDGSVVSPTFFIHFMGVVHNDGSILKFQIAQKAYDLVIIRLVVRPHFNIEAWSNRERLVKHVQKVMGPNCVVRFEIVNDIPKSPTGKHLYTVQEMTD